MEWRVLVCGGRNYDNWQFLYHVLNAAHSVCPFSCLIHGAARGADTLAGNWALENHIPCEAYPAAWWCHGNAAGPFRNQQMLELGKPNMVVAFPGGRGTADMIRKAEVAGVLVAEIPYAIH